jgi:peptidoglycan/LPS O-acetylase OafA/YrhL
MSDATLVIRRVNGMSVASSVAVPAPPPPSGPDRIAALDGLRGMAILLVLLHNDGGVSGGLTNLALKLYASLVTAPGWWGVQLFFALSGFLITRILLESKGARGYFSRFYMRRALRIFPLYYVAVALVFFAVPHTTALEPITETGTRSSFWYWTYLANWIQPFGGLVPTFGHFWSLAVEEQFYLLWPALVLMVSERSLAIVCSSIAVAALVIRFSLFSIFEPTLAGSAAYHFTISRCDSLALGALVAIIARNPRMLSTALRWIWPVMVTVLVAIGVLYVRQHGLEPSDLPVVTFGQTLFAVLSAALVLVCATPRETGATRKLTRALSVRWLRSVGKYSYAIYIFHVPMNRLARPIFDPILSTGGSYVRLAEHLAYVIGIFACCYLAAVISWYVIEQPFLSLKRFFPLPRGVVISG